MPLPEHLSNRHQSERRTRTIMTKGRVSSWRWCPAFCAISACSFTGEYGILGLVQQIGTCRGEAPPSCCARPFCRLKAPLGLSLLRSAPQTRTCRGEAPPSCCRKTVLSLKSPTGAFIVPLHSTNANLYIKENIDETVFMFALFKCRKFDKRRN